MTYIDAMFDKEADKVYIVGRDKDGNRYFETHKPDYTFYYEHPRGNYKGLYGESLNKVTPTSSAAFYKEIKMLGDKRKLFETDLKPVFKALEKNYLDAPLPPIHTSAIDIETGFCERRGFAPPEDPHQPITAITISLDWLDTVVTLALRPTETVSIEEASRISSKFDNCFIFDDETELLKTFYDVIEDSDILYGWNSEGFDIPYIVNRTSKVLSKDYTRKLSHWNQFPRKRVFLRYGKEQTTYDICGRVHLDYLQLYRKYTYHEMHSYRLDAIGEYELKENKIHYEGTLDSLYKNDFEKFIEYNIQDVKLLVKLESKLKFIGLTNLMAHENCVLLPNTVGVVALTDQAVILEAHRRGLRVPTRKRDNEQTDSSFAGAYVADPLIGLHTWIASVDINSLYPSTIRALNMSPETIVGQVRQYLTDNRLKTVMTDFIESQDDNGDIDDDDDEVKMTEKWKGLYACLEYTEIMNKSDVLLTIDLEDGSSMEMTATEIHEWIFADDSSLCISANGTIFRTDINGLIPGLLEKWYADRKEMQKKAKDCTTLLSGMCISETLATEIEKYLN